MAYFSEHDLALISAHRKPVSRFGFAVLLCYLKNVGFAPDKSFCHQFCQCEGIIAEHIDMPVAKR